MCRFARGTTITIIEISGKEFRGEQRKDLLAPLAYLLPLASISDHPIVLREVVMARGKMILGMLAAAIAVEFCACGKSDQRMTLAQMEQASVAPGAGSPMSANAKLEKAVRARFDGDERLKAANLNVNRDVTKNEVTLSGTVDSEALRARAVELAKSAHVGVIVTDKIIVKPRQSNSNPPGKTTLV